MKPRDLYGDPGGKPKGRPDGRPGGAFSGKPKADGTGAAPRPTTTAQIVDRYKPAPRPRGGTGGAIKQPTKPDRGGKPGIGKPSIGQPNNSADGRPMRPGPVLVDRYKPSTGDVGPRDFVPGRPHGRPSTRPGTNTLLPTPALADVRGTRAAPSAIPPRLLPRPRATASVLSHHVGGSCFGPVWDPCWSWGQWDPLCCSGLTWSLGIGSGSFCWGWSSWYPWHCYRRHHWFSSYWSWWNPWCLSYATPIYWPATYVYADPQPSTVVVIDSGPAHDTVVADDSERTPEEQARADIALGDFYFREGRFREAADSYAKARTLLPDDASLHFVLADAVFALGDYHFAAFLIGEGLRLDPDLARAETDKRLLYGDPKVFEQQMQTLMHYLEEKPYDAMAHLTLGYNLKFSGKRAEAEQAFRRVLEIDPDSTAAALMLKALTEPAPSEPAPADKAGEDAGGKDREEPDEAAEPARTDR